MRSRKPGAGRGEQGAGQSAQGSESREQDASGGGRTQLQPAPSCCLIRPATAADIAAFYGAVQSLHVAMVAGRPVALGGFVEEEGRLWVFLDVRDGAAAHGASIVRALRRELRQANRTVFAPCNAGRFPRAERLLRLLGFEPTEETRHDMRVWTWQN
jgi:hypothetical protein